MNSYSLTRRWFDFVFENSDKVKPVHSALYLFMVEQNNRLGWKKQFSLPSYFAMQSTGISNFRTYSKTFKDLQDWKFIKLIKKAKNQHSANVIALLDAKGELACGSLKAELSSLDKAIYNNTGLSSKAEKPATGSKEHKNAILKELKNYLEAHDKEQQELFIDEVFKLEAFQNYLWQKLDRFQSPSPQTASKDKKHKVRPSTSSNVSEVSPEISPSFKTCQELFRKAAPSYVWEAQDDKYLKALLQKIQSSIKQTGKTTSVEASFKFLIEHLPDWWRNKKFTLFNLNKHYNEIINEIQQSHENHPSNTAPDLEDYAQNFGK